MLTILILAHSKDVYYTSLLIPIKNEIVMVILRKFIFLETAAIFDGMLGCLT